MGVETGTIIKDSQSKNTTLPSSASTKTTTTTSTVKGISDTLSAADKARISSLQTAWSTATAAGNHDLANQYHSQAEAIRASYGYSGGTDGSQEILLGYSTPRLTAALYGGSGGYGTSGGYGASYDTYYQAGSIPTPTTAETYIKELYNAQSDAAINELRAAYESNVLALDSAASRLSGNYNDARNRIYGESEIERNAFNERAAAQGLGTGAGSQARLSSDNALLGNLGAISRAEADKRADIQLERTKLETAYKNSITSAQAKGELELAKALLEDLKRVEAAQVAAAKAQADENYRAYSSRF